VINLWWEVPGHLESRKGELYIGGISARELYEEFGERTEVPVYVYNLGRVRENFKTFWGTLTANIDPPVSVHYAVKANGNEAILRALHEEGAKIDAVSPNEIDFSLQAGFSPDDILHTGVGSSEQDIRRVLESGAWLNADSVNQLETLKKLMAGRYDCRKSVSIRVDPGIQGEGECWKTVTAGRYSSHDGHEIPIKFGVPEDQVLDAYSKALEYGLDPKGIHFHIGSNWKSEQEVDEFLKALDKVLGKAGEIADDLGIDLEFIDVGGGPGIRYKKSDPEFPLQKYSCGIMERVRNSVLDFSEVKLEPGRYIVGDA